MNERKAIESNRFIWLNLLRLAVSREKKPMECNIIYIANDGPNFEENCIDFWWLIKL